MSFKAGWREFTVAVFITAFDLAFCNKHTATLQESGPSNIFSKERGTQLGKSVLGLTGKKLFNGLFLR